MSTHKEGGKERQGQCITYPRAPAVDAHEDYLDPDGPEVVVINHWEE